MFWATRAFVHKYSCSDHPRELPKLNEIKDQLGKLYDDLAAMQAESKIGNMSDAYFGLQQTSKLGYPNQGHMLVPSISGIPAQSGTTEAN